MQITCRVSAASRATARHEYSEILGDRRGQVHTLELQVRGKYRRKFPWTRRHRPCILVAVMPVSDPAPSRETDQVTTPKRRDMLSWILGTWATGVLGAVFYPIARFLVPPEVPEATSLSTSGGSASKLVPNSGRIVPFGSQAAIVVRTQDGELRAFSGVCTHLTCTVQYRPTCSTSGARVTTATTTSRGATSRGHPPGPCGRMTSPSRTTRSSSRGTRDVGPILAGRADARRRPDGVRPSQDGPAASLLGPRTSLAA